MTAHGRRPSPRPSRRPDRRPRPTSPAPRRWPPPSWSTPPPAADRHGHRPRALRLRRPPDRRPRPRPLRPRRPRHRRHQDRPRRRPQGRFGKTAHDLGYHISAANYLDIATACGMEPAGFAFINVEKEPTPGGEHRVSASPTSRPPPSTSAGASCRGVPALAGPRQAHRPAQLRRRVHHRRPAALGLQRRRRPRRPQHDHRDPSRAPHRHRPRPHRRPDLVEQAPEAGLAQLGVARPTRATSSSSCTSRSAPASTPSRSRST
jgi:hypothetical protein